MALTPQVPIRAHVARHEREARIASQTVLVVVLVIHGKALCGDVLTAGRAPSHEEVHVIFVTIGQAVLLEQ